MPPRRSTSSREQHRTEASKPRLVANPGFDTKWLSLVTWGTGAWRHDLQIRQKRASRAASDGGIPVPLLDISPRRSNAPPARPPTVSDGERGASVAWSPCEAPPHALVDTQGECRCSTPRLATRLAATRCLHSYSFGAPRKRSRGNVGHRPVFCSTSREYPVSISPHPHIVCELSLAAQYVNRSA